MVNAKKELVPKDIYHIANNISCFPKVVLMKETMIEGIREMISLSDNRIPELWEQFLYDYRDFYNSIKIGYSICEMQGTTYTKDGDVLFPVMIGCYIGNFDNISSTLIRKRISGGKYAVFTHYSSLEKILNTLVYF